jgi:hypothetical protein
LSGGIGFENGVEVDVALFAKFFFIAPGTGVWLSGGQLAGSPYRLCRREDRLWSLSSSFLSSGGLELFPLEHFFFLVAC